MKLRFWPLRHVFPLLPMRPGIIRRNEVYALRPRRVIVEPELHPLAWRRIVEVDFSALFEIVRGYLVGIRHDAVYDLDSVAIGLVLIVAADGVEHRRREKRQHRQQQKQQRQRRPVVETADFPSRSPARQYTSNQSV